MITDGLNSSEGLKGFSETFSIYSLMGKNGKMIKPFGPFGESLLIEPTPMIETAICEGETNEPERHGLQSAIPRNRIPRRFVGTARGSNTSKSWTPKWPVAGDESAAKIADSPAVKK